MPTEPLPTGAQPLGVPAVYQRWWAMTEACSGHRGDMSRVRWYEVPGATFPHNGQAVSGYWTSAGNEIVLAHDYTDAGFAVRHEMLHALLRRGGHPRDEFLGACAAIVDCAKLCAKDAGPWSPPMAFAHVPAESVRVTADPELLPPEPDGERWLSLRVSVRNRSSRAVLVQPPVQWPYPPAFGFDVRGPKGGMVWTEVGSDSSRFFFAPSETKQFLYEFLVGDPLTEFTVPPGAYVVRGIYAGQYTTDHFITATP